jgi:hypothetical protein
MSKECNKCNNIKNISEFHKNKNCNDGYMNTCKLCRHNNRKSIYYDITISEKKCFKCKLIKSSNEFNKDKSNKTGLQTYCKKCGHINQQKYYKNGGLKVYIKELFRNLKRNASKRNIDVNISEEDIISLYYKQEGLCKLTNIQMTYDKYITNNNRVHHINNISVDRIDSNKHYSIDNIQLVCVKINIIKWDLPLDEFIKTCKLVVDNFDKKIE